MHRRLSGVQLSSRSQNMRTASRCHAGTLAITGATVVGQRGDHSNPTSVSDRFADIPTRRPCYGAHSCYGTLSLADALVEAEGHAGLSSRAADRGRLACCKLPCSAAGRVLPTCLQLLKMTGRPIMYIISHRSYDGMVPGRHAASTVRSLHAAAGDSRLETTAVSLPQHATCTLNAPAENFCAGCVAALAWRSLMDS